MVAYAVLVLAGWLTGDASQIFKLNINSTGEMLALQLPKYSTNFLSSFL